MNRRFVTCFRDVAIHIIAVSMVKHHYHVFHVPPRIVCRQLAVVKYYRSKVHVKC